VKLKIFRPSSITHIINTQSIATTTTTRHLTDAMARIIRTPRIRVSPPHPLPAVHARVNVMDVHASGYGLDDGNDIDEQENGRADGEDEDNDVANEIQPVLPPLPHTPVRSDDENEEDEQHNGGADRETDDDAFDIETDEGETDDDAFDIPPRRSDGEDDDEEEEEVEMNDEKDVEIDDGENVDMNDEKNMQPENGLTSEQLEEQFHQESGNSTDSDSNFDLNDEESSSIGTSVLEFSDGDGSDIIDLSGSHDKDNAGDIVIPVGQGMSYNDPIVLE
jgi:hypothetical protein